MSRLAEGFNLDSSNFYTENAPSKYPLGSQGFNSKIHSSRGQNDQGNQHKFEGEYHLNSAINLRPGLMTSQDLCQSDLQIAEKIGVEKRQSEEHLSKFRLNRSPSLELFYYNKPENNQERGNQKLQAILESLWIISCNHVASNLKLHPQANQSSANNLYKHETFKEIPLKTSGLAQSSRPY